MLTWDDEVKWILGRPNFTCIGLAQALRSKGHEIESKAEAEQAAVIFWMLEMYAKYGAAWRVEGPKELQEEKADG